MFTGILPRQSNRATWAETMQLFEDDDGTPFDIATATEIALEVKDRECGTALLAARLTSGTITRDATIGVFSWSFTPTQMSALCPKTYAVGITITAADGSVAQIAAATLPIIEGIVT